MAEEVHFIGVASAKIDGDFCIMRLAASDGKAYRMALTDAAVQGIVRALQPLIPALKSVERSTLQVVRAQPLVTADGRKAILLESQVGAIAFELSDEMIAILQRQLADLSSMHRPTQAH